MRHACKAFIGKEEIAIWKIKNLPESETMMWVKFQRWEEFNLIFVFYQLEYINQPHAESGVRNHGVPIQEEFVCIHFPKIIPTFSFNCLRLQIFDVQGN